ncbi:MAG: DUF4082 domain-containing protein [Verrucomicrobiales bacterium]|nr:DUF4082 domain-containing protein [Verrucomicrobiales bacterium]
MNSPKIQNNIMKNQIAIEKGTEDFVFQQPQQERNMNHKTIPSCLTLINHASTLLLRARSVNRAVIAAVSCLALAGLSAPKANAAEMMGITGGLQVFNTNWENETLGTRITVGSSDLYVTGMGIWDWWLDGFVSTHDMGIWSAGTLIASATMPAGTAAPFGAGEWRYVTLNAPVTLLAGQTYTIGAQFFNGGGVHANADEWVGSGSATPGVTFSPDFTIGTLGDNPNLMRSFTTAFAEPVNVAGVPDVFYSVNLEYTVAAVPEPQVGVLVIMGLAGMFFVVRKNGSAISRKG